MDTSARTEPSGAVAVSRRHPIPIAPGSWLAARLGGGRWERAWDATGLGVWVALARVAVGLVFGHLVVVLLHASLLHTPLGTLGNGTWLGAFDRWDARYYTAIAAHGYPVGQPATTAFFPGYPLVLRSFHDVAGGLLSYSQAGTVVSCLCFVAAAGLFHRLVARRFDERTARLATVLFCWFPTSCFFLAPYSEALFALEILVVATLVDSGRWWPAAAVAGLATATSPLAVALVVALVVAGLAGRRGLRRVLGYGLVGSWGVAVYMVVLGIRFGDALSFAHVVSRWHRVVAVPFAPVVENIGSVRHVLGVARTSGPSSAGVVRAVAWVWMLDDLVMAAAAATLVFLTVRGVRRGAATAGAVPATTAVPAGRTAAAVPVLWTALLGGVVLIASVTAVHARGTPISTEADARLVSVAFPLYPGLVLMLRRWLAPTAFLLSASVGAALLFQTLFNLGYWMT